MFWQVITYRRDFYLIIDDWAFLGTRLDILDNLGLDDFLLRRHNEHLMGGMVLWDVSIARVFGLRDYTPWVVSVQLANLFVTCVVRRFATRIGVTPLAAALVCPLLLVWGPFDRVGYWAPEAIFGITLSLVMTQFGLSVLSPTSTKRDLAGATLATLGIFIQSICAVLIPITVITLAIKRRWLSSLIALTPMVAYGLWFVTYRNRDDAYRWDIGGSYPQVRDPKLFFDFSWNILSRTMWQTANAPLAAVLTFFLAWGFIHLWRQGRELRTIAMSAVVASLLYLGGFTWSRGYATLRIFEMEIPSRYASVIAMLLLPITAIGFAEFCARLTAKMAITQYVRIAIAVSLLSLLFSLNLYQRLDKHGQDMEVAGFVKSTISSAAADPGLSDKPPSGFVFGDSVFFDLTYSDVQRFLRLGWL